jgi:hypothetical protein
MSQKADMDAVAEAMAGSEKSEHRSQKTEGSQKAEDRSPELETVPGGEVR